MKWNGVRLRENENGGTTRVGLEGLRKIQENKDKERKTGQEKGKELKKAQGNGKY